MTHATTAGTAPATRTTKPLPPARRAPWVPTLPEGPYRLPPGICDRLTAALAACKNRDACLALATWLGRFWSSPRKLLSAFPIDRRAICGREDLGLSEARVRGAIATLEAVGFLDRAEPEPGQRYQRTAEGLHRRPIMYRLGAEFGPEFARANSRAQAARGAGAPARRPAPPRPEPRQAPAVSLVARRPAAQVAQKQVLGRAVVLMGEDGAASPLEVAIERLRRGIGL